MLKTRTLLLLNRSFSRVLPEFSGLATLDMGISGVEVTYREKHRANEGQSGSSIYQNIAARKLAKCNKHQNFAI
jgi:hypothetical protein